MALWTADLKRLVSGLSSRVGDDIILTHDGSWLYRQGGILATVTPIRRCAILEVTNVELSKPELKQLVHRVVVAQGNSFLKELLRESGEKIGVTKEDFANNLHDAIDEENITQGSLAEVEGWGDQHPPRGGGLFTSLVSCWIGSAMRKLSEHVLPTAIFYLHLLS